MGERNRRLLDRLKRRVAKFGNTTSREKMSIHQQLTDEALTYARIGDFDEARHRLRLRDHPKWTSVAECEREYEAAMKEKRQRESLV